MQPVVIPISVPSRPGAGRWLATAAALALLAAALPAAADVQVLHVNDTKGQRGAAALKDAAGEPGYGVRDHLCVVNTVPGRGVRLSFSGAHGAAGDGKSWVAVNALTGERLGYRLSASLADGSGAKRLSEPGSATIDIPAALVATSSAACPAQGNVIKWVVFPTLPLGNFDDVVSITAMPL